MSAAASSDYDLIVIGAGPGGYVAAIRAAQLGLSVACVEKEPSLGGTCLRIGCIPSKALLESSERYYQSRNELSKHGVRCAGVELDLPTLMGRKDEIVAALTKGVAGLLKKNKISRHTGHARLAGPGRVDIETAEGQVALKAKNILLATGSKPASLPGVEMDGDRIGSSTEALAYSSVPEHLVVIGAGYIGIELGSVWARLGARVTILEYLNRILPGVDSDLASESQKLFEKQGLTFRLGTRVTGARLTTEGCVVEVDGNDPVQADRVLVAVGRVPNTEGLGLETVGIELDSKKRIPIGKNFVTSAKHIYAIGDVVAGPMLAHKAEEEGIACAEFLATGHGHINYDTIPSVVYTDPELASVGKTEEQLKEQRVEYRVGLFPFRANGRALGLGQTAGKVKVLADAKTDEVLGVHILGARAGELINEAAAAMAFGASSEDLARVCHAHPTLGEALREGALAVSGRALHS